MSIRNLKNGTIGTQTANLLAQLSGHVDIVCWLILQIYNEAFLSNAIIDSHTQVLDGSIR